MVKNILLAEDQDKDFSLFLNAVQQISRSINVIRLTKGYNIMQLLKTEARIDAIFLAMPLNVWPDVLKEIRTQHPYKITPVIILCSPTAALPSKPGDDLMATFYLEKPVTIKKMKKTLKVIFES